MVPAAGRGSWHPPLVTCIVAAVLAGWAAHAFSTAGAIPRLRFTRTALVLIGAVLLVRAAAFLARSSWRPDLSLTFRIRSSAIVMALGLCFGAGTWNSWRMITEKVGQ